MNRRIAISSAYCLVLGLLAGPLRAQTTVSGGILVQSGVEVESRPAPVVIVPQPEIIVVERIQGPRGWWKKPKYRGVTLYYDGTRFYRRPFDRRVLSRVVVYQWGGRYYIDKDEGRWQRGPHKDHDRGRHGRDH